MLGSRRTEIQYRLLKAAAALGYDGIAAAGDRSKFFSNEAFSAISLPALPAMEFRPDILKAIDLTDVLWLEKGKNRIVCVFETQKKLSSCAWLRRLSDMALMFSGCEVLLTAVAPDKMEKEILAWLRRPALLAGRAGLSYLLFSDLFSPCESLCKLGSDHAILEKLVKRCV